MVKCYGKLVGTFAMHGSYGKGKKVVFQAFIFQGRTRCSVFGGGLYFCVCQAWHVIYFTAQARHTQTNHTSQNCQMENPFSKHDFPRSFQCEILKNSNTLYEQIP